ncbi:hypothetical protein KY360_00655 [Candidatus Woesearchaeota archaeon]|nr:hypothetical protein [Candidatus Woesearchaeota archaeon]
MKMKIPQLKKKVNAFLIGEEGKISKESLLKVGALLSGAALGIALASKKAYANHVSHSQGSDGACNTYADDPSQCTPGFCDDDIFHGNNLAVGEAPGSITPSHAHCVETHNSHSSHSSHGSHGSHSSNLGF